MNISFNMNVSFKEIKRYSDATYAAVRAENGNVLRISGGVRLANKLEKAWKECNTFSEYCDAAIKCKASIHFNSY